MAIENPYMDAESGVFKNKFNIKNQDALSKIEYMCSSLNAREIEKRPIPGKYDLDHASAIHKHLLKEVYDWAGKPRTLNFSKKDPIDKAWSTPFCKVDKLKEFSDEISKDLASKNNLKGLPKDEFVKEIASVFAKLNYLHPFPEGNGRSTQLMLSQLAKEAGHKLDFKQVHSVVWNQAAARCQEQIHRETGAVRPPDLKLMQQVFSQITKPLSHVSEHEKKPELKRSI